MQPNGRIPPMKELGMGWASQFWSGTSRGIWFVLTGGSIAYKKKKNWAVKRVKHLAGGWVGI